LASGFNSTINNKVMIKSILVAIGLVAMTAIIATSGIAIQTVQALIVEDPGCGAACGPGSGGISPAEAAKNAALSATANSLRQTSEQITSNPSLSSQAKLIFQDKMLETLRVIDPNGLLPCDFPGVCLPNGNN
jgi:hypothetical protein